MKTFSFNRGRRGVTLVELMVAVSILSIAILGLTGAFQYISKSIRISRARTLAINLAQEKVENLKNLSYYKLLLTTDTVTDNNFSPALVYDKSNYPPEDIYTGGITFKRGTYVAFAQTDNNVISTVSYTYPDPGLKQITSYVLWQQDGTWRKLVLQNLYENPYVNTLDGTIRGTVSPSVAGANVRVVENPDWNATTNASGVYNFNVVTGTYTVRVTSAGWYDANRPMVSVSTGGTTIVDLTMTQIGSGTVSGSVWASTIALISQVVAATTTACGSCGGSLKDIEYVELFNPTTAAINVAEDGPVNQYLELEYRDESSAFNVDDHGGAGQNFDLTYVSTWIPPSKYYLIANATFFYVAGNWMTADAHYDNLSGTLKDYIRNDTGGGGKAGGVRLVRYDGLLLDAVGWCDADNSPPADSYKGTFLDLDALDGMNKGDQLVRISSPLVVSNTIGRAYDSDSNTRDFYFPHAGVFSGLLYRPFSTADAAQTVLTGKPMPGAFVESDDLLGTSTRSYTAYMSSPSNGTLIPYAPYGLYPAATGTWTLTVSSGLYLAQIGTVTVTQFISIGAPNASSSPTWVSAGSPFVRLSSSGVGGFISGRVTDVGNRGINNIQVLAAGVLKYTNTSGYYFAYVSSGPITVIANPNNADTRFVQTLSETVVYTGQVTEQDFILSQGGVIQGYATTGTSALPNVIFTANRGGYQYGSGSTDNTGYFYIKNMTTGTYVVSPALDPMQTSDPVSTDTYVSGANAVFAASFTVIGALGSLAGTVTYGSDLHMTGALIVASTKAISSTPPSIVASSAGAQTTYYSASSKADGTYTLDLRGPATYYISVYVPIIGATSVTITTKTFSDVVVNPSITTPYNIVVP
ncbi:MAG: carboxypeptidase regulatory-like domain-containing protein [Elusimicrobiota bacterium]|jgi:prepilin-type N-terminal cleavage/methylation domain-containing protein